MKIKNVDIAVIGGGPAGLSACLELDRTFGGTVALFESDAMLGGIPRSSGMFFGMRDMKRIYTGKTYADKLEQQINRTNIETHLNTTVLRIIPGKPQDSHQIVASSDTGIVTYDCRAIILATGCYEISRQARLIPGSRPAGIFTTGSLQKLIRLGDHIPGSTAVVVGSEIVAFSAVMTLKKAGIKIQGMVEEQPKIQTLLKPLAGMMKTWYKFPINTRTRIKSIYGKSRVQGILLEKDGKEFTISCDTVIITGGFRPESALLTEPAIEQDAKTKGPVLDNNFMTSVPNIYAAGNVIRGALMHDLCALEGKRTAKTISKKLV